MLRLVRCGARRYRVDVKRCVFPTRHLSTSAAANAAQQRLSTDHFEGIDSNIEKVSQIEGQRNSARHDFKQKEFERRKRKQPSSVRNDNLFVTVDYASDSFKTMIARRQNKKPFNNKNNNNNRRIPHVPTTMYEETAAAQAWQVFEKQNSSSAPVLTQTSSGSSSPSTSSASSSSAASLTGRSKENPAQAKQTDFLKRVLSLCVNAIEPSVARHKMLEQAAPRQAASPPQAQQPPTDAPAVGPWGELAGPSASSSSKLSQHPSGAGASPLQSLKPASTLKPSAEPLVPWADRSLEVLQQFSQHGLVPHVAMLAKLMQALNVTGDFDKTIALFERTGPNGDLGVERNEKLYGIVLHACAQAPNADKAEALFTEIASSDSLKLNDITMNNYLLALANSGQVDRTFEQFHAQLAAHESLRMNSYLVSTLLIALSKAPLPAQASAEELENRRKKVHGVVELMTEANVEPNIHILNRYLQACIASRCDEWNHPFDLANKIEAFSRRDKQLYTALKEIRASCDSLQINPQELGDAIWSGHLKHPVVSKYLVFILNSLVGHLGWIPSSELVIRTLETFGRQLPIGGLDAFMMTVSPLTKIETGVYNAVMKIHLSAMTRERDAKVFETYRKLKHSPHAKPNIETINLALRACVPSGDVSRRDALYPEINHYNLTANLETYLALLEITEEAVNTGKLRTDSAELYFTNMTLMGVEADGRVYRSLIRMHCHAEEWDRALEKLEWYHREVFPLKREQATYTSLLAYLTNKTPSSSPERSKVALSAFRLLLETNMPLDLPAVHIILQTQPREARQGILSEIDAKSTTSNLIDKLKLNTSLGGETSDIDPSGYFSMKDLVRAAIRFGYGRWHMARKNKSESESSDSTDPAESLPAPNVSSLGFKVLGLTKAQFDSLELDEFLCETTGSESSKPVEISLSLSPDAEADAAEMLLGGPMPPPPPPPRR